MKRLFQAIKALFSKKKDFWADARALHNKLKKGWDAAAQASQLQTISLNEIYRSAGESIYYTFVNPLTMPLSRLKEIEKRMLHIEHGIDADYLRAWDQQLEAAIKMQDLGRIALLHQDLKTRRTLKPTENAYIDLACYFMLRHDENPYTLDPTAHARKKQEVLSDPELYTFFLNFALETVRQVTQQGIKSS